MTTQRAATTSSGQEAREHLLSGLPVTQRRELLAGVWTTVLEGGDGAPVVLLHGPAGNATHWMRVITELATTHTVIVPDLPGHGESQLTDDDGALDAGRLVAWLGELIERTCPSPPTLVGYGLGGAIAAHFAAGHGDRLDRLVLVDALGLTDFAPAPEFGVALNAFMAQPSERRYYDLWRHCALDLDGVRAQMGEHWESFTAYNLDLARTPGAMPALGGLMAQVGLPAIPAAELERIAVPTTLIWGRHDLATALPVAEAARDRYGWPLHVIEDCADDPPIEQPAALLRALRAAMATGDER